MNLHSNAFLNRIEIFFYSLLISIMSGVNRIRGHVNPVSSESIQSTADLSTPSGVKFEQSIVNNPISNKATISQVFGQLIIWMILGFATGFLIGMINPG